jgi:hypothetical protein
MLCRVISYKFTVFTEVLTAFIFSAINVSQFLRDYTAQRPRRDPSSYSYMLTNIVTKTRNFSALMSRVAKRLFLLTSG